MINKLSDSLCMNDYEPFKQQQNRFSKGIH